MRIIGVPEGEEKQQENEKLFEKNNAKRFPNLVEGMKLRLKSMTWNIRTKKTFNQNSKKKREFKKTRIE